MVSRTIAISACSSMRQGAVHRVADAQARADCDARRSGLEFMLGGKFLSFYGFDSLKAFGHLGYSNILAWCDPERQLVCCLTNNGKPFVFLEMLAWLGIVSTITQRIQRTP
jgi:hypothetical protein